MWERYADLYPNQDLVYTVGASDYKKDWFYAHVTRCIKKLILAKHDCLLVFNLISLRHRKVGENAYKATTWQIKFKLDNIEQSGSYTLRIALASATFSILEVNCMQILLLLLLLLLIVAGFGS